MRLRRTRMYAPGNNAKVLAKGRNPAADSVILDLEDSVAPHEKDAARIMVRYAIEHADWGDAEVLVRINPMSTPYGPEDVRAIGHMVDGLVVPKCESRADVLQVDALLEEMEAEHGVQVGKVGLVPLIETAKGVLNAFEVATASPRNMSLAFGAEDFTADTGGERTKDGLSMLFARSQIVCAAKAAGIQASDTVFGDFRDEEGLYKEAKQAAEMGFDGKGAIHPKQLPIIIEAFTPEDKRIEHSKKVMAAIMKAEEEGAGVVALGGKMIDAPVRARAEKTLALARAAGKLDEDE
jgi:citrate lyase subunit beta/citryl-CoA lyase